MQFDLAGAPHQAPTSRVAGMMQQVLLALLPAVLAHAWFFGWGILVQILLAVCFGLAFEWLMLRARQRPVGLFLGDYSVVVTAVLLALCLPPLAPWWIAATGMLFAVVIAKHLYGGLGYNLFNPAMVGLAAVIIAFPLELSQWLLPRGVSPGLPDPGQTLSAILRIGLPAPADWHALSGATPLDLLRSGGQQGLVVPEIREQAVFGSFGGRGWAWIALAYAAGGLWLLQRRIISWQVPLAVILSTLIVTTPAWLFGPDIHPSPLEHLLSGALVIAAFFIATDPVSGSATPLGKLVFGAGVAVITLAIRQYGGFPDGVAFAILLMNMLVPLIDRYTRPRSYGHRR